MDARTVVVMHSCIDSANLPPGHYDVFQDPPKIEWDTEKDTATVRYLVHALNCPDKKEVQ